MPPKKKKTGPVETDTSKVRHQNNLTVYAHSSQKLQEAKTPKKRSAAAKSKAKQQTKDVIQDVPVPAPAAKPEPPAKKKTASVPNDMDALLKPFYYDKKLTDPIDTARDKWNLLPAFLRVKGLVKQHLDSYDFFVNHELKKIIKANALITSEVHGGDSSKAKWIQFTDIRIGDPGRIEEVRQGHVQTRVTPNECRLRDMTYAAPIYVDIVYPKQSGKHRLSNVLIGRMPIMLRTEKCVLTGATERRLGTLQECSVDPGGYFIVRGQEKVILVQEQLSKNRVIVEQMKGITQASVTSHTANVKTKTYVLLKKNGICLKHNSLNEDIPVTIMLRAMGVQSDQEILLLVAGEDEQYQEDFTPNLELAAQEGVFTQEQALQYIADRLRLDRYGPASFPRRDQRPPKQLALDKLANTIIPHVTVDGMNFRPKALYIAFMTRRVIMALHDPKLVDDRDYVGNKRLELAGQMLSLLFEDLFKDFTKSVKGNMDKLLKKVNPTSEFDPRPILEQFASRITGGMERAIGTGNWTLKRFRMDRAGVSHVLSRLSYISALGMMTRISSQFEKTRKISGPRALQPSQFGMLCPSDTPEGESCGLVKNLALMTHITTADDEEPVRKLMYILGAEDVTMASGEDMYEAGAYIIFLNGTPAGLTREPKRFLTGFRKFRRVG